MSPKVCALLMVLVLVSQVSAQNHENRPCRDKAECEQFIGPFDCVNGLCVYGSEVPRQACPTPCTSDADCPPNKKCRQVGQQKCCTS
ncbi:hypothetical protein Ddc_18986 [Ditylenchus destructor]|nr:hypothetical protein Ddc_18986 [Ditylenchus destructor]